MRKKIRSEVMTLPLARVIKYLHFCVQDDFALSHVYSFSLRLHQKSYEKWILSVEITNISTHVEWIDTNVRNEIKLPGLAYNYLK